jgi:transposase
LITKKGIKPVRQYQWRFKAFWLYGAVEPATGESVFLQFSHVDSQCFKKFLTFLSESFPNDTIVLQVDNAAFHKAKRLRVPENIVLLFQPPHSPELNPIERVWEHIKQDLAWDLFDNLDQLEKRVDELLASFSPELIASLSGFDFILEALSVANI